MYLQHGLSSRTCSYNVIPPHFQLKKQMNLSETCESISHLNKKFSIQGINEFSKEFKIELQLTFLWPEFVFKLRNHYANLSHIYKFFNSILST